MTILQGHISFISFWIYGYGCFPNPYNDIWQMDAPSCITTAADGMLNLLWKHIVSESKSYLLLKGASHFIVCDFNHYLLGVIAKGQGPRGRGMGRVKNEKWDSALVSIAQWSFCTQRAFEIISHIRPDIITKAGNFTFKTTEWEKKLDKRFYVISLPWTFHLNSMHTEH